MGGKTANKAGYFDKLKGLLEEYKSIFIVTVDNVSSQQMHEIRQSLRGEGVVLMGKNTMVRFFTTRSSIGRLEEFLSPARPRPQKNARLLTKVCNLGSPCPQDLHPRLPRVRASPSLRQG